MQLQGELAKGGGEKVYKNAIDVLVKTWRNEGIHGLQRGLGPAVCYPPFELHLGLTTSYDSNIVCIPGMSDVYY